MQKSINIDTYFSDDLSGVYYVSDYSDKLHGYICDFKKNAKVLAGLSRPSTNQVGEIADMVGDDMPISKSYVIGMLSKVTRGYRYFNSSNITSVGSTLYSRLLKLKNKGKGKSVLKNFIISCLCWVKNDMCDVLVDADPNTKLRILYMGKSISRNEVSFLSTFLDFRVLVVLSGTFDNVLMSEFTKIEVEGGRPFNDDDINRIMGVSYERGVRPNKSNDTNNVSIGSNDCKRTWKIGSYSLINGVHDDIREYKRNLVEFNSSAVSKGKNIVIVSGSLPAPSDSDKANIRYVDSNSVGRVLSMLYGNLKVLGVYNIGTRVLDSFIGYMVDVVKKQDIGAIRVTSLGINIVYWLLKYIKSFDNGIGCFVLFTDRSVSFDEWCFMGFLRTVGLDVIVFNPANCLQDYVGYDISVIDLKYSSNCMKEYPTEDSLLMVETVAHRAEDELTGMIYTDTGMYRSYQYPKAVSLVLRTTYDEIQILWNEELKYRTGFSVDSDIVHMPVLYAIVYGVPDGDVRKYVSDVKVLDSEDTIFLCNHPYFKPSIEILYNNDVFRGGLINTKGLRDAVQQKYGYLRREVQDYLVEKMKLLVEGKYITNVEYSDMYIISLLLNIDKRVLQIINKFDFTKKNPKLVIVETGEYSMTVEDSVYVAFLSLIGFDVVIYVPTGYNVLGSYLAKRPFEYQVGEYVYDVDMNGGFTRGSLFDMVKSVFRQYKGLLLPVICAIINVGWLYV